MISSRCATPIVAAAGGTVPLTRVRERAKAAIESMLRYGNRESAFEVWINEPSEALPTDDSWFDESLQQARQADIVVVLFSGDPGSALHGRGQGVCHAELLAARADAPTKVRVVDVRKAIDPAAAKPSRAKAWTAFAADVDELALITARPTNDDEAVEAVLEAVASATHRLALHGVVEARRGSKSLGDALDWRRLDFRHRKEEMERAALDQLELVGASGVDRVRRTAVVGFDDVPVLVVVHAAPEGLSVASSRELVGQPQRLDRLLVGDLDRSGAVGPLHVVLVPARATANQARTLMGTPDVMTASFPAGLWVADAIDRSQALVIGGCADRGSTGLRVDEAFDWLRTSGEVSLLVGRARRRNAILREMAKDDAT